MSTSTKPKRQPRRNPLPPHSNPEAERAVLGGCLVMPEHMPAVAQILTPDDFEYDQNVTTYTAMLAVHASGQTPDFVTVDHELQRTREMGDRGAYVHELVNTCTNPVATLHHARIVLQNSVARKK